MSWREERGNETFLHGSTKNETERNSICIWVHRNPVVWSHKKNEIMTSFHFGPTEKWNWKKHLCMWHYLNETEFVKQIWYLSEKLAIIIWQKLTIHQLRYTENAKKHYSSKMHRRRSPGIEYYDNSDLQKWWYVLSKRFGLEYHHILLI